MKKGIVNFLLTIGFVGFFLLNPQHVFAEAQVLPTRKLFYVKSCSGVKDLVAIDGAFYAPRYSTKLYKFFDIDLIELKYKWLNPNEDTDPVNVLPPDSTFCKLIDSTELIYFEKMVSFYNYSNISNTGWDSDRTYWYTDKEGYAYADEDHSVVEEDKSFCFGSLGKGSDGQLLATGDKNNKVAIYQNDTRIRTFRVTQRVGVWKKVYKGQVETYQLRRPALTDIAQSPITKKIYICDYANRQVEVFDEYGRYLGPLERAGGAFYIDIDSQGNIFAMVWTTLYKFNKDHELIKTFGGYMYMDGYGTGLCIDKYDRIIACSFWGDICIYDNDGTILYYLSDESGQYEAVGVPFGLAIFDDSRLVMLESMRTALYGIQLLEEEYLSNKYPVLSSIGNKIINAGEELKFMVSAHDQDGDQLDFKARGYPIDQGAELLTSPGGDSAWFIWTPASDDRGVHNVNFFVSDGKGGRVSETILLMVKYSQPEASDYEGLASSAWPCLGHDAKHTGQSPYIGSQTNTIKWSRRISDKSFCSSPSIGGDGTIYIGDNDGELYALNPQDGSVKWNYHIGSYGANFTFSPTIGANGVIYIGSGDGYVYALNPDSSLKWRYDIGGMVQSAPILSASDIDYTLYVGSSNYNTLYVGSVDGKVYAFNPGDGSLKWNYRTEYPIYSSPTVGPDGTIYIGSDDNKFYALHPNGCLKWSYDTGNRVRTTAAIGEDGTVYIKSAFHYTVPSDQIFFAFNPDGTMKWSSNIGGSTYSSPGIGVDGILYIGGKLFNAINPEDGSLKWSFNTRDWNGGFPAVGANGTVYIGCVYDVFALNPGDGSVKWNYQIGPYRNKSFSPPAIGEDGIIYVGDTDGIVYAFGKDPMSPILIVSHKQKSVSASAGETTFSVRNAGSGTMRWNASVVSGSSWLRIFSGISGINYGTVRMSFYQNTSNNERIGKVRITASNITGSPKEITIIQRPNNPHLIGDISGVTQRTDLQILSQMPLPGEKETDHSNHAPAFIPLENQHKYINEKLEFRAIANDYDGDPLHYTVSNLPAGAQFDPSTQTLSWTPARVGEYNIEFMVEDGRGGSDYRKIAFYINYHPPAYPIYPTDGSVLNSLSERLSWQDTEAPFYAIVIGTEPELLPGPTRKFKGNFFDLNDLSYALKPGQTYYWKIYTYRCEDYCKYDYSISPVWSFTLSPDAKPVDHPPVLSPIGNKIIHVGQILKFTLKATDEDGDKLSFSISPRPTEIRYDPWVGEVIWTPSPGTEGDYTLTATVWDGKYKDSETFTVTIKPELTPPVAISYLSKEVLKSGDELSIYGENFGDIQGGSKVFFGNTPAQVLNWSNINIRVRVPGIYSSATGTLNIKLIVKDKESNTLVVTIDNKSPQVSINEPEDNIYIDKNEVSGLQILGNASDEGSYINKVEIKIDNESWQEIGNTGWSYTLDISRLILGQHTISVMAYDKVGNISSSQYITLNIIEIKFKEAIEVEAHGPYRLDVDDSGHIYLACRDQHNIQVLDSAGQLKYKWGQEGTGNGEFYRPKDISVDSDGQVYVVDTENYRLQVFDKQGNFKYEFGSRGHNYEEFSEAPTAITFDNNNIYVGAGLDLYVLDKQGNFRYKWSDFGLTTDQYPYDYYYGISDLAILEDDSTLYAGIWWTKTAYGSNWISEDLPEDKRVVYELEIGTDTISCMRNWSTLEAGADTLTQIKGIAVEDNRFIYVASYYGGIGPISEPGASNSSSNIQIFDSDGGFILEWSSHGEGGDEFLAIHDIAIGPEDKLYVAHEGEVNVYKIKWQESSGSTSLGTNSMQSGEFRGWNP